MTTAAGKTALVWIAGGWLANAVWEVVQLPLYTASADPSGHLSMCLQAAVVDVGILVLLYGVMSLSARRMGWWRQLSVPRTLLLVGVGAAVAVLIEVRALAAGRWAYSASMPLLPGLGVGWSPILQMVVVPVGLALLCRWWLATAAPADSTSREDS